MIYTGETKSKDVRTFVIGDPVDVRIEDHNYYLKNAEGKEIKVKLLTRSRAIPKSN